MHVTKSAGKPDAGNPHVRFDERGTETGLLLNEPQPRRSSTLPILLTLPPNNNGALHISNLVYGQTYSVPNLDYAYSFTESLTDKVVAYQ